MSKKNNTKLRDTFAQVFNEKIAKAGFSIYELAEISSISVSQLYDYRKAFKSPTTDALDLLGEAFKCDPADFLKPGAAAKRSAKPNAKPSKPSKKSAKPSKSAGAKTKTKPSPKKPKGKKHKASAAITLSTNDAPTASSSEDASPAASGDRPVMTDLDTPEGMSAANSE